MKAFTILAAGIAVANAVTFRLPGVKGPKFPKLPSIPVVDKRAVTCTPVAGGSGSVDDVPAIQSAIAACPSGSIVIPTGTTYYINSAFSFAGCVGCTFQVDGTLKVASDTDYWNGKTAIFLVSGITGLIVKSTTGKGLFDGNGQDAWDLFATDSSYDRPTLFYIKGSNNVIVENLTFKNAPNVFHSSTGGSSNIQYNDITLTAVSKNANLPKNTDGWDIGQSTNVIIKGATVVNDDDCVALKPGAKYVEVYDITCTGSHGLSVGSLGSKAGTTDTVSNIYISGATMINSTKATGIKVYPGGTDHGISEVSNVTFANIVVQNSDYAFQVQTCYGEDADYCAASPSTGTISGVVLKDFSGTTSSKYAPTVANIDCSAKGTCGITVSGMTVKPPSGTAKYLCANAPSGLGVTCTSGASG